MFGRGADWRAKQTHCPHGHEFTPENTHIAPTGYRICKQCKQERERSQNSQDYRKGKRQELKNLVQSHYSGGKPKCACCGNDYPPHLTLDHIDGGGVQHRKEIGGTDKLYRWLKQQEFPPGFQVLCFSCNAAKHIEGRCGCQDERFKPKDN